MPAKIYTRRGDHGETSLFDGSRRSKADAAIEALGDMDELVAALGLAKAEIADEGRRSLITGWQKELYTAMALVGAGDRPLDLPNPLTGDAVTALERQIDDMDSALPPLRDFVIPGGCRASALCHQARAICRRAERRVVALGGGEQMAMIRIYLNRLSDLLFVLARTIEHEAGRGDPLMRGD